MTANHDNLPNVNITPDIGSISSGSKPKTSLKMFSKHGFRLLPVNSMINGQCTCGRGPECPEKSRGKHPRILAWQENATTNLIQLAKWMKQWPNTNWALATGIESKVWVLDIDNHKNGYESLKRLEAKVGKLPETVRVKTGGGGLHIYYAWPADGSLITNKVDLTEYEGIDVRGEGGYVVVPPALHRSGNHYEWIIDHDPDSIALAQAPKALIDLVSSSTPKSSLKEFNDNGEPWKDMEVEDADRIAEQVCGWIKYAKSEEGANTLSEQEWAVLIATARSLRRQDDKLAQLWSKNYSTYSKDEVRDKWNARGYKGIPSCAYIQSQFGSNACLTCPFRDSRKGPGYHIRVAYNHELGQEGPYGAPRQLNESITDTTSKSRETMIHGRGEASMEAQQALNEMRDAYAQAGATAPAIDVMEDDYEGDNSVNEHNGQAHTGESDTGNGPRFRVIDNLEPHLERVKELEQMLRNGHDPYDLLPEVAKVLSAIKKMDEFRYFIERDRLIAAEKDGAGTKKGYKPKYSKKTLDDAVKSLAEREAAEMLTKMSTVGQVWPDAPVEHHELPLPVGYKYSDEDGVHKFVPTSQGNMGFEEVSSQPTYMEGWREDINTGTIEGVIRTRTRDRGWIEVCCPPSHHGNRIKVAELKDIGCAFKDEGLYGKFLDDCYDLVRTQFGLPPELGTSRLGWHIVNDQLYFVFPEESYGAGKVTLNRYQRTLKEKFSVRGSLEKEREALIDHMTEYTKLAFALGTVAAAVIMRAAKIVGKSDLFGVLVEYVSAQTGTGKSTAVSAAMSIFGAPSNVQKFDATEFGITQYMTLCSDLPTAWQEAQSNDKNPKNNKVDHGEVLHILGDGGGKLAGTKEGGLRENPHIYGTMLMANNENFVDSHSAKQGELQRVFSFDPIYPENSEEVRVAQEKMIGELSRNHGHGGREMIKRLIQLAHGSWEKLCDIVEQDYDRQFLQATQAIPADIENRSMFDRRAKIVALVRVGLQYLLEYGYGLDMLETEWFLRKGIQPAFEELIREEQKNSGTKIEWLNYLGIVRDWINQEMGSIHGAEQISDNGALILPHDGYIGAVTRIDGIKHICIQKRSLNELLRRNNNKQLSPLLKAWESAKIITPGKDQNTRKVTWGPNGEFIYGICFRVDKDALDVYVPDKKLVASASQPSSEDDNI